MTAPGAVAAVVLALIPVWRQLFRMHESMNHAYVIAASLVPKPGDWNEKERLRRESWYIRLF
jgi:hypothetical protein